MPEQPEQHEENDQNGELSQAFRIVLFIASWLFWLLFLLIPTATGMHGTDSLEVTNSIVFTLIGLTFCTAQNIAIQESHTGHMVIFCAAMTILSIWF